MSNSLSLEQWMEENQQIDRPSSKFFLNESYSDVTFVVGPQRRRVPGHKLVLSTCSWEFYNVFEHVKLDKNELPIDGVSYEASLCFLEFCYKGKVELEEGNAWDVLSLAFRFKIEELIKVCKEYLYSDISIKRIQNFFRKGTFFPNAADMKKKILEYLGNNFYPNFNSYNDFPYEMMKELAQMDNLNADETLIFDVMIRWSKNQCETAKIPITPQNIRKLLRDIFYEIRFPIMKIGFILDINDTYPGLLTSKEILNIARFITKELKTCDGFKYKLRNGSAHLRNAQTFALYHGTLQRLPCCSDGAMTTEKFSSELSIKFKCTFSKKMIGFGTYRKNQKTRILSCTIQNESSSAADCNLISKSDYWPICWKVDYKEEYFTEPMQLQPVTWYTLRVKFNEDVPILHSTVSQDLSEKVVFAGEQNNVIPFLLFGSNRG